MLSDGIDDTYSGSGFSWLEKKNDEEYQLYFNTCISKKEKLKTFTNSIGMEFVRVIDPSLASV